MQVSHMPLVYFAPVLALKAVTVGKEEWGGGGGGDGWGYIQRSHYSFMHAPFISTKKHYRRFIPLNQKSIILL